MSQLFQIYINTMTTQVDILTSLVDFYNLKKEGKVSGSGNEPCLVASDKTKYEGVMPILAHLDTKLPVLGTTVLERALVKQWVTYQVKNLTLFEVGLKIYVKWWGGGVPPPQIGLSVKLFLGCANGICYVNIFSLQK